MVAFQLQHQHLTQETSLLFKNWSLFSFIIWTAATTPYSSPCWYYFKISFAGSYESIMSCSDNLFLHSLNAVLSFLWSPIAYCNLVIDTRMTSALCAYQRQYVSYLLDRSNTTITLLYVLVHFYVNDSLLLCFSPVFHSCVFWCKRKPYIVPLMFP